VDYLNRIWNTGQDRLNRGADQYQTGAVNKFTYIPVPFTGNEVDSKNVPQGQVTKSPYGDDAIFVDAPNGGSVAYDIPQEFEGRTVQITMFVVVDQGAAELGVNRDDGQVVAAANQSGKVVTSVPSQFVPSTSNQGGNVEVRKISYTVRVPSDGKGYGRTDSAHHYQAVLQVEPGAKVHVLGGGFEKG
jgi:hypothetical protein